MPEPEEVQQEAVDLTTVDDAQLDAQIAPEGDTTPPPETVPPEEPREQDGEVQPAPEAAQQPEAPPAPAPETVEQRLARLEAQTRDKEAFIQRQANELGMLRKIASRPQIDIAKVEAEIREQFHEDPVLATKRMQALEQYKEDSRRDKILMSIPDLPSLVDIMAEVARVDGEKDEVINAFKADPFRPPIHVLHELAVRARAYRYVQSKEAEIRSKYATAPAQVPQGNPHRQGSPVIRGSAPGGSTSRDASQFARTTDKDIASMSDKELDAFLAKGRA